MKTQKLYGNDPVTPHMVYNADSGEPNGFIEGITIRQYFAAMAMQGFTTKRIPHEQMKKPWVEWVAEISVEMADALIAELNK